MCKIAAGIVIFNPNNYERFIKSFSSVVNQFSRVYVFDNSTVKVNIPKPRNVIYMTEYKNKGIAYGLNRIMKAADNDGFEWVVTFDQDSIVPKGLLDEYKRNINTQKIGIVCPLIVDRRRSYDKHKVSHEKEYVTECITSGSCTLIDAWKKIGRFDEWLFVDLVDNDFCKRMIHSKYKILRLNNVILNQEFGVIEPKSKRIQNFWIDVSKIMHNINFAKLGYKKKVSPMRVYYTNRNVIYLNKKLKKYGGIGYKNYNASSYLGFWIAFNLPSILRSSNKIKVISAISNGIRDGRAKKVSDWTSLDE